MSESDISWLSRNRHKVGGYGLQFGKVIAARTDNNVGFYAKHAQNT